MLQIEAATPAQGIGAARVVSSASTMKLSVPAVTALCALLAMTGYAQARPEGMSGMAEATTDASTSNTGSMDSASHEADSSSEEDKNITVLAKTAALCPPQQQELQAIEAECLSAVEPSCLPDDSAAKSSGEMTTEASPSTTEATSASGEHCKSICDYHLCILEKLEVLDSSGKPDKMLLSNWIAHNITDEKQKEQLQNKLSQCPSMSSEGPLSSTDDSKSSEENDDTKTQTSNPKCCKAAKKVAHCVFSVECPVIKLL